MIRKKRYNISGKSLYLVVFISFILSVFLLLFISNNYYNQVEILYYQNLKTLSDVGRSAVLKQIVEDKELSREEMKLDSSLQSNQFQFNSVYQPWGAFYISGCQAEWRNLKIKKAAISGNYLFDKEKIGLYLADEGKYLSIAGNTHLSGTCYLPALGIRSVYIDGEAYRGGELIHGTEKSSNQNLPDLNSDFILWLSKAFKGDYTIKDTLISEELLYQDKLSRDFLKSALVYESKGVMKMQDMHLSGKIIIRSDTCIILKKDFKCENIIIMAPKIIVESGFIGSVQLFARDSLLLEEQSSLLYPSFISVYNVESKKTFCYISNDSRVQGGILCGAKTEKNNDAGELYLADNSEIHGIVYCSGSTRITGSIYGSLYTNRFVLKTSRGYYENHILNAVIDPVKQYKHFLVPAVLESSKKGIIQWVH